MISNDIICTQINTLCIRDLLRANLLGERYIVYNVAKAAHVIVMKHVTSESILVNSDIDNREKL